MSAWHCAQRRTQLTGRCTPHLIEVCRELLRSAKGVVLALDDHDRYDVLEWCEEFLTDVFWDDPDYLIVSPGGGTGKTARGRRPPRRLRRSGRQLERQRCAPRQRAGR